MGDLGPFVTYDVDEPAWWSADELYRAAFMAWMRRHGIDPNTTLRIEVDLPHAMVTEYVRTHDGGILMDAVTREPVITRRTVPLSTLPPDE